MRRRLRRRESGTHSVEFALLLPIYLLIVTAIADFGWLAFHAASLYGAAHVGCRTASLEDPGFAEVNMADVLLVAESSMEAYFENSGPGCGVSPCITSASTFGTRPGRSLKCSIEVHYEPLVGYVVTATDLESTAVVRLEYQRGG